MKIGVLALQGAFIEHERRIAELGATPFEIRRLPDIDQPFDGLILPGGESTVLGKLLHELGLFEPLKQRIAEGLPTFGTCAGLILLARKLEDDPTVHFGLMDITAGRNAYGRQLGSFAASIPFAKGAEIPATFIRAPAIRRVGNNVEVLASVDGIPVAARERNMLVTAFHPELNANPAVHKFFLDGIRA